MKIRAVVLATLILLVPAVAAFSQIQAVVSDFRGKVEVLAPGGSWQPVDKGMVVDIGNTISTGFNSSAVLKMGLSTVTVNPLTRLTIAQLVENQGKVTTGLTMPIGRIQAQVVNAPGQTSDFQVRSSISTAAVRGTEFDYDGYRLIVQKGVVALFNRLNEERLVAAGEGSTTDGSSYPTSGEDDHNNESGNGNGNGNGGHSSTSATGSIVISW